MFKIILLGSFATLVISCSFYKNDTHIPKNLKVTEKTFGLDVRTSLELYFLPAPGAHHISMWDLKGSEALPENKERPIFVFCEAGVRSASAKKWLEEQGYSNVVDITDWRTWNRLNRSQ